MLQVLTAFLSLKCITSFVSSQDWRFPGIAFFASRDIDAYEGLRYFCMIIQTFCLPFDYGKYSKIPKHGKFCYPTCNDSFCLVILNNLQGVCCELSPKEIQ